MKIKFISQHDQTDCGPACLAMLSNHFGKKVSLSEIRDSAGTDRQGTSLYGMIIAGEKIGLDLEGYQYGIQDLKESKFPIIAHVISNNSMEHFIIIEKKNKNNLTIVDPAKGRYKVNINKFSKQWTGIVLTIRKSKMFNKSNSLPSVQKLFFKFINKYSNWIGLIIMSSIIINLLAIAGTFYFKFLVDGIIPSNLIKHLHEISIGIIVLYLLHSLISYWRLQLTIKLSIKIDKEIMLDYFQHVLKLPISFFETRKTGDILSRFMDSSKIRETLSSVTVTLCVDTIMVILGGIVLYLQSKTLFLISLIFLPVYILICIPFQKAFEKFNREFLEKNSLLNSFLIDCFSGIYSIKNSNSQNAFTERANLHFDKVMQKLFKSSIYTNLQVTLNGFVRNIATVLILWAGSYLVINKNLTLGELLTFNALIIYYFTPIERLINIQPQIQASIVAARRLLEILNLEKEKQINRNCPNIIKDRILIENLHFQYGFKDNILNEINMCFEKGSKTSIVGESGSGKSTIAKLINYYYQIEKGSIYLDNYLLEEVPIKKIRNSIGYVSQNDYIFNDTLLNNLLLGLDKKQISFDRVIEACKAVKIHDFIMSLPFAYDSLLESKGANLSTGQIQRLLIARIFIKNPDVYIFDEATSALDIQTETEIMNRIDSLTSKGKTIIVISHNLRNVKNSDNIYVLKKGTIIESGCHENLLYNNGYYSTLWNKQKL